LIEGWDAVLGGIEAFFLVLGWSFSLVAEDFLVVVFLHFVVVLAFLGGCFFLALERETRVSTLGVTLMLPGLSMKLVLKATVEPGVILGGAGPRRLEWITFDGVDSEQCLIK
jgi:hypothetical protein